MSLPPDFIAELRKHFAGDIRLDLASKLLYSTDASIYQIEPLGVVLPRTQEDLHAAVELAARYRVPVLPRGAGSSLAGQAIGEAVILDCSRWLDHIIQIDPDNRIATVEPGVVLSNLNREAKRHGLQFGPDPASAERATMGGVIANNATGAHSILYGMTADHLRSADVIFGDGSRAVLGPIRALREPDPESGIETEYEPPVGLATSPRFAAFFQAACEIREQHEAAIKARFPKTWRNSAGYRLNYLLPWSPTAPPEWSADAYPPRDQDGAFNLAHLLAGSEGTLAVMARATVGLVPRPQYTVVGILAYGSIEAACDAIPELLDHRPSAIELVPRLILQLAQRVPAYADQTAWVRGDPAALLAVEFSGGDPESLTSAAKALGPDVVLAESDVEQASVWALRKVGLGLLDSRPLSARPASFIEDCAIPVDRLGEFVREIQRILAEHGTEGGIYGHASAGCLHIRPILDLKTGEGVRALRSIAEETARLTLRVGGSMASEHGDGIARGGWLRQTYGDEVAGAMRALKRAADPDGLLNPRKMLDAPPMDSQLRYGVHYRSRTWHPGIDFGHNGGLDIAIEQCNGQGVCRKDSGVMCPSFQATREEMHSTRGRANLLRALISSGQGLRSRLEIQGLTAASSAVEFEDQVSRAVLEALDLCLGCKGCKAECPSGVDMAKLKSAFLENHYRTHLRPLRDYVFGYFHVTASVLSRLAPAVNAAGRLGVLHQAAARVLQISPRRPFPPFARHVAHVHATDRLTPVILLRDPFTHYIDSDVEVAAYDLLSSAGFAVRVLNVMGAGASLVSKGFLKAARAHAQRLLKELAKLDQTGELPVLAIEPSELSTLRSDYGDLLPDMSEEMSARLSRALSVDEFLVQVGAFSNSGPAVFVGRVLFHPHCHERADAHSVDRPRGPDFASLDLLRACGYDVELTDAGCCGMAGTFGYEAEHYELSQQIGRLRLFPRIAREAGALVAATGASCRMQIAQGTHAVVEHPLVLAARSIAARRVQGDATGVRVGPAGAA